MADATIIWKQSFILRGRYRVIAAVYEVAKGKKFPSGIKAKFVLIDLEWNAPRLLVDNHEPFGFHLHASLPYNKDDRIKLETEDYQEAYQEFLKEVERIVKNEG